ncbi:hypothetical protein PR048_031433 [Dryococelus australis]|uniref:Uncharacterized protein n=1 Tax=Dryococelus australis TaxID=614101 RepID=A0ABQ9G590_9NEOP|nr:hypothetical protein PR048_031433 [Dryococelus australis]
MWPFWVGNAMTGATLARIPAALADLAQAFTKYVRVLYKFALPYTRTRHAVAERLVCSPPTKSNRIQSLAGSLPDFRMWGSCRTMPLVSRVFSGISRFPRSFIPALLHTHLAHPFPLSRPLCGYAVKLECKCEGNGRYPRKPADGNTARLARRSDEALGVRVTVALSVPRFLASDAQLHSPLKRSVNMRVQNRGAIRATRTRTRSASSLLRASRAYIGLYTCRVFRVDREDDVQETDSACRMPSSCRGMRRQAVLRRRRRDHRPGNLPPPPTGDNRYPTWDEGARVCQVPALTRLESSAAITNYRKNPVFPNTFSHFPRENVGLEDANRTTAYPAEETRSSMWRVVACELNSSLVAPTGSCGVRAVRPFASHLGEPGLIPSRVTPGFSQVGISCRKTPLVGGFSRGSPERRSSCIPALLHTHLASLPLAPKTYAHVNCLAVTLGVGAHGSDERVWAGGTARTCLSAPPPPPPFYGSIRPAMQHGPASGSCVSRPSGGID